MPALRDAYRNVRRPFLHAIAATTRAGAESHAIVAHEHTLPVRHRRDNGHHAQDTNGTSAEVTAHLRRFVKYLTDSEKAKAAQRKIASNATIERPWLL